MTDSPQSGPGDTREGGERRPESRPDTAPGGHETTGTAGYPQSAGQSAMPPGAVPAPGGDVPPVAPSAGPPGSQQVPGPTYGPPGSVPPGAYPPPPGSYPPPPGGYAPAPGSGWDTPDPQIPPQGAPGTGYDPASAYAVPPGLDVGRALGFAWDRFRANFIPWIAITLVGFVAYLAVTVVVNVAHVNSLLPVVLIGLIAAMVVWLLQAAMIRGALYETDGTPPDFQSFFTFVNAGNVLITALLVFVAACIGAALCVLPAIVIGYLCMFSLHYVIDQDLDPFTAIKSSVQLVVSNFVPTLLLALAVTGLTLVATLLCGIGLLVVGPLSAIAVTYSYRMLTGGLIA